MFDKYYKYHVFLVALLALAAVVNLMIGSVRIPVSDVLAIISDNFSGKASWEYIVLEYRLPKLIIACIVGAALSVAGMMMQTLFQNPMAEPYILGVSSGASLGVAVCILGKSLFSLTIQNYLTGNLSVILFALGGSVLVLFIVLGISQRIKQIATLLIVGLMFSSFTSAFVNVLTYFSSAEELLCWDLSCLTNH